MNEVLGILGGMGPLASAEFLKTIYELNITDPEQGSPPCILYSDPTFPDRTEAIINGSSDIFIRLLTKSLERICKLGATRLVISCITSHFFLPQIPSRLRDKVISLVDLIVEEVLIGKRPHLLLCSKGTCRASVFQNHDQWGLIERYVVTPNEDDQNVIHGLIYQIKQNIFCDDLISSVDSLMHNYQVDSLIAGCTEMHLLTKHLMTNGYGHRKYQIIDPLLTLAKDLRRFINY